MDRICLQLSRMSGIRAESAGGIDGIPVWICRNL